jgi:aminoglycoside 3-N-acetyltransferase
MQNTTSPITQDQLVDDLNGIGIRKGDILLVHSSLSKIGFVKGGPEALIDAFLEVLGKDGTLLMPSFQGGGEHKILRQNCLFDLRTSPSELGLLTETFRKRKGVIRSISPTHCTAGLGAKAEELLKDHQLCTVSVGKGSPYEKLAIMEGKILLMGVGHECNTILHYVENVNGAPTLCRELFRPMVIDITGRSWIVPTHAHMPGLMRCYKRVEEDLLGSSCQKKGKIGMAESILLEASPMVACIGEKINKNPLYLIDVFTP